MQAKFADDPHFRVGHEREGDKVQTDYCFVGPLTILVLYYVNAQAIHAILGPKGVDVYMVSAAVAAVES